MITTAESIYLHLYFPYYNNTNTSRFESFFKSLSKKERKSKNFPTNSNLKKSTKIFPEKIIQSLDKRSSVILKNIPKNWSKGFIKYLVESFGNINYLYVYKNNKKNYCSVFVNYINYKSIIDIYMFLRKIKNKPNSINENLNFKKSINDDNLFNKIEVFYSKTQGKENLKKKFSENKETQ